MKLHKILYFFVLSFFNLFFFSCSNDVSYSNQIGFIKQSENYSTTRLTVFAYSDQFVNSRTILPGSFCLDDFDFYIYGDVPASGEEIYFTNSSGSKVKFMQVNIIPSDAEKTSGFFYVNTFGTQFTLKMVAVKKGQICTSKNDKSNFILTGNSTVSSNYYDSIKIKLTGILNDDIKNSKLTAGVFTKNWSFEDLKFDDGYSIFKCKVGIYKQNLQNEAVYEKKYDIPPCYESPVGEQRHLPSKISDLGDDIFVCTVNPGIYNFTVCIYNQDKSRCYYYSDTVRMYANQSIEKLIQIPNVMTSVPNTPDEFIAGYDDPDKSDSGKYTLHLEWKDNAYNEEYYQLEMIDIDDRPNSTLLNFDEYVKTVLGKSSYVSKDKAWEQLLTIYEDRIIKNNYFENDNSVTGGLYRNSSFVNFSVNLGTRYLVRLVAVNANGKSKYVYPDIYSNVFYIGGSKYRGWNWDSVDENNSNYYISRYRISYNMNNGAFYDDISKEDVSNKLTNIKRDIYASPSVNGTEIFNPCGIVYDSGTASLKQHNESIVNEWNSWRIDSYSGDVFADKSNVSSVRYTDYKGLNLYAKFDNDSDVISNHLSVYCTETAKGGKGIPGSNICIVTEKGDDLTFKEYLKADYDRISINKSEYKTLYVTVNVNDIDKSPFSNIWVETGYMGKIPVSLDHIPDQSFDFNTTDDDGKSTSVRETRRAFKIDLAKCTVGYNYITVYAEKNSVFMPYKYNLIMQVTE